MRTDTGQTVRLADYQPTPYAAPHVQLMISLDPKATVVKSTTHFERRDPAVGGPLVLAGDDLSFMSAALDGKPIPADAMTVNKDQFILHAPPATPFALTISTLVVPDENSQLMGLYRSSGNYCTQCEAEGYRRITYAYDRPDVLSVYDVWVLGNDETPIILSNGNLTDTGITGGRPFAAWHDPFPKPSYLFALVAGNLDVLQDSFTTMDGRKIALAICTEPGKALRAKYAMDALKRSMTWDEERFGRTYDLDMFNIVAVSDFNMGAMENKGLNVFNDRYILADPELATDLDYAGIEAVVAHEYFHNWTGNRITCRDWFQLCLKEGLTVYRDQEFTSDVRSRGVKRVEDVRRLRQAQFREDASPLRHAVRPSQYDEISNLYTATVYEKGAELIRMLHTMIGEDSFRAGMDLYFDRHDGDAATMEEFIACFPVPDTEDFFRWYQEPGSPKVEVEETSDDTSTVVTLRQVPPLGGSAKPIPVRVAMWTDDGEQTPFVVDGASQSSDVVILGADPVTVTAKGASVASLLRGFSAPVIIARSDNLERDLKLLAVEDDAFSAWDAAQRLAIAAMTDAYKTAAPDVGPLAAALASAVSRDDSEPALRGLLLTPPTKAALINAIGSDVDAERIEAAHNAYTAALGDALAGTLATIRQSPAPAAEDVSADAAGQRLLRNAALLLQARAGITDEAADQALSAKSMTDRLAGLSALAAAHAPQTDSALDKLFEDYGDEGLVLDKFFALQAMRTDGDAIARAEGLTHHPAFTATNPNRVRSVVGAFAQTVGPFHAADGSGYRFLTGWVSQLDEKNPQLAARLLTLLSEYRRFDEPRQNAAREALKAVQAEAKSADVADIVRRLLG